MPVTFLRHTTPAIAEGVCYGQLDLDVAETFEEEAARALDALPFEPELIISSPLLRCVRLAEMIGDLIGADIVEDDALMEMDFGRWEGIAWDTIARREIDAWAEDFANACPHGGESVTQFKDRVDRAMARHRGRKEDILIVCHAGVIRAALADAVTPEAFGTTIAFGQFISDNG